MRRMLGGCGSAPNTEAVNNTTNNHTKRTAAVIRASLARLPAKSTVSERYVLPEENSRNSSVECRIVMCERFGRWRDELHESSALLFLEEITNAFGSFLELVRPTAAGDVFEGL